MKNIKQTNKQTRTSAFCGLYQQHVWFRRGELSAAVIQGYIQQTKAMLNMHRLSFKPLDESAFTWVSHVTPFMDHEGIEH